ncbi:MAG: 30S ribosomal protein S2 [Alphaproteobacteria bacterium]|nr:30S ribosomal protein S2 [Alphaproteobacteria bacterium]MBN2779653.1 30S ribosomal protein S2 [Alphaproteobacteria bacterium]
MTLPTFDVKTLVENGVHFGHQVRRRNPKMNPYIFDTRNKISIIDVRKTAPMMKEALAFLEKTAASGGQILFVGTKNQASDKVREMAEKTGQFYVNHRWLGGMLTNFKTVSKSIKHLEKIEKELEDAEKLGYTKKEKLNMERDRTKLEMALGGIRKMHRPAAVVIIDITRENIALAESKKLGIPVVAICDTNCNPDNVDYIIPGNDDSSKAISLYADLFSDAILSGLEKFVSAVDKKSVAKELTKEEPAKEVKKEEKKATPKTEKKAEEVKKEPAKKAEETAETETEAK